jgi:uncharacterized protein YbjQ (UPF0145 family)
MDSLIQLGVAALLLLSAYFSGSYFERQHFKSIRKREQEYLKFPVTTLRRPPAGFVVESSAFVAGNVVVSLDHFKRFLARLRAIFGGRIKAYEPLMDRARREAILRMREEAIAKHFDMVINVRIETSRLATGRGNGKGTAGVEVLAFGTALKTSASTSEQAVA